ncbi:MAG: hypothetical protein AAB930_00895 [Patescibacteria group bacterium]
MKQVRIVLALLWLLTTGPVSVWAASTVTGIMAVIKNQILTPLTALLFVVATVIFLWGVVEMIASGDNEEARSTGRRHMIWGIIGLFIMLSAITIVKVLCASFGVTNCPVV